MKYLLIAILFVVNITFAQNNKIPEYYDYDKDLSNQITEIVKDLGLDKDYDVGSDGIEQISLAVIDLTEDRPQFAGFNYDNFIYPASVYKIYVAAEILKQISRGKYELNTKVIVNSPNDVDKSKEISFDPRPLLKDKDTVTINYLLDLMITRSDNSAANVLIDLADRKNINSTIQEYGWEGSEVTRKFLSRKFEDEGYKKIRGTETSALHTADFMARVETNWLVNQWVSQQMKVLLGRQRDQSKLGAGLPKDVMFYNKTGWFSYWTNDVGIVDDGSVKYVISCFLPIRENEAIPIMKELSFRIYELMVERN